MEQDSLCISWNSLPWKKFHRKSASLQRKIYDAKQNENRKTMERLQKLLLKSKSLHYIAVKRITDYYSFKGIFLSEKIKSDLVNEMYVKIYRWKTSLFRANRIVSFMTLSSIKDVVAAYIWKSVIDPSDSFSFIDTRYQLYSYTPKTCVKDKKSSIGLFKMLSENSFLRPVYSRYLKFLLAVPTMCKFDIFRSVSSIIPSFYLPRCTLNFRLGLHSLYFSMVLSKIKYLESLRCLDKLDPIQENLFTWIGKHQSHFVQTRSKLANILFLYKRFFRVTGLR